MLPSRRRSTLGLLGAACALSAGGLLAVAPAAATTTPPAKNSPFAAPRDSTSLEAAPGPAAGSVAPGTAKESPYAAAKDERNLSFGPTLGRLWWLLLPAGIATASYLYLRSQEAST